MSADPRVEAVLAAATAVGDRRERGAYLDQACAGDANLRREVESLLAAHDKAGTFLENPASGAPLGVPPSSGTAPEPTEGRTSSPLAEKEGDRIGRYKLLELIGQGGFGDVWMAEQEEPVRRRVALKVIKLGMDTREIIARFEAERQALALMDHPNIAKVHDGGATEAGRPYFVMELVRGIRITDYCDANKLATIERLTLFIQVCQAVQHAHQKGIIHRDLKPSNILVTVNDGVPVPKVIDFGIAKATEQRLTDKTVLTRFMQFLGTPAYMSPEQAELTSLDIDTRSDIYSLGVLLYELLTGRTPFDPTQLLQAGLDEMRRTIREKEPVRPSTRLSTLQAADQTEVARRRQADPPRLIKLLRGDLDWIVMKCLEKDRTRRYETANGLAADLRRHLNNEPVSASPPGALYRWQKFARKHRTAVAVVAGFFLLLTAAAVVSTALGLWASRERKLAEESAQAERNARLSEEEHRKAAQTAQAVAENNERRATEAQSHTRAVLHFFLDRVLTAARPESEDGGLGREATIRQAVAAAEPALAGMFPGMPHAEGTIRTVLGQTYYHLGDYPEAIRQQERGLELLKMALEPADKDMVAARHNLALMYSAAGRIAEALTLQQEIWEGLNAKLGPNHTNTLTALDQLAGFCRNAGQLARAVRLFEEVVEKRSAVLTERHPRTIVSMNGLANAYRANGQNSKALPLLEKALTLATNVMGPDKADSWDIMGNLANAYQSAGLVQKALPLREENWGRRAAVQGLDHPATLTAKHNLAMTYKAAGDLTNAITLLEETLARQEAILQSNHPHILLTLHNLGSACDAVGDLSRAADLFEKAASRRTATLGPGHPDTLASMNRLAMTYQGLRRRAEAVSILETVVQRATDTLSRDHSLTLDWMHNLAAAYRDSGRLDDALRLFREALDLRRGKFGADDQDTLAELNALATCLERAQRFAEAEPLWRELLERKPTEVAAHPYTQKAYVLGRIARCLASQGKFTDAESACRELLELQRSRGAGELSPAFEAKALLGWALLGQKQYADAESMLLQAYEGFSKPDVERPSASRGRTIKETAERLVQLYEAWGKPDQAAELKRKLARLEQAAPVKPPE